MRAINNRDRERAMRAALAVLQGEADRLPLLLAEVDRDAQNGDPYAGVALMCALAGSAAVLARDLYGDEAEDWAIGILDQLHREDTP
ncbi:hypothetical protein [Rhodococcus sp. SORGH_AS_0303]|uniref:hypothetical protein n=1 Tax=Rhodococcus sp. SORGH_AS_0303 TaxID=3041753 RepID=UPI002781BA0E|nr:hypothetical protein [Rhodococcus sp. SORGH_AS_0303]MDQ1201085.1 hypothetical protein [Rhodococcus sp. SORGH_AS_0303]